jgi:hypothetical protein
MSRPPSSRLPAGPIFWCAGPGLALIVVLLLGLPAAATAEDPEEKPAKEAAGKPAQPPLRFTDDDLEKYHKPKPGAGESEETDAEADAPPASQSQGAAAPKAPAKPVPPRPRPVAARNPPKAAKLPSEEPLKRWQDRDALEAFRRQQLQELREKIAVVQSRLDYLNTKRGAISNPNPTQVGGTGPRAFQYDENGNPVYQTDAQGDPVLDSSGKPIPVNKPSIAPGRHQPNVLPMFLALPEPQTDEDRENDKRMKPKQLLETVEEEIKTVEEEMERLRKIMVSIETRFAQESAAP